MYIQRQVLIYAIFAIKTKLKSEWSHFFLLTKYVKRLDIQNTLSVLNRRFVINYIAK